MKIILFTSILFVSLNGITQSDKGKTIFFGLNVGGKFANKYHAIRYNGTYNSQLEYTINTQQNYDRIYQLLGDKNFYLPYDYYPTNIRYSPGFITGVTAGYQISPTFQMSIDANFSKLKVVDVFSIQVEDPSTTTSQEQYRLGNLYAEESRFNARYNIDWVSEGQKVNFIYGISGIFTSWRMDQYFAEFEGHTMQLFSVHDPTNNITKKVRGSGFGGGINLGVEYRLNNNIVLQMMYQPYQTKVDYGFTIYKKFLPQHDVTVRILWK